MKTKPLFTNSETRTQKAIDVALMGSNYRALSLVRISDVLETERGERIPSTDRNFLLTAHFDFVIYERNSGIAAFVVEFDGPLHEDPIQIKRDITKNRICMLSGLPLVRIGYSEIQENDRLTLIEFMTRRFLAWQQGRNKLIREIEEYLEDLPPEQIKSLTEDGFLDPSIDPSFLFNIKHPFPGIEKVARRLTARFRIVTDYLSGDLVKQTKNQSDYLRLFCHSKTQYPAGHSTVHECAYTLHRNNPNIRSLQWSEGKLITPGVEVIKEGATKFAMQWTLPVIEDYNPNEVPINYLARTGNSPIWFSHVPGIHIPHITEWFSEYLALREVEDFAINGGLNLKK